MQNSANLMSLEQVIFDPKINKSDFKKVVNDIYIRQFSSYVVLLKNVRPFRGRSIKIDKNQKEILITDMGTCSRFLNCFAPSIIKLKIEYAISEPSLEYSNQLDLIVNKYCAEYITDIQFTFAPKEAMTNITRPFTRVESVTFIRCFLTGKLTDFNYFFPNMKRLNLTSDSISLNSKCVAVHFPNLIHLELCVKPIGTFLSSASHFVERNLFERKHAADAIRLNSQLQSLSISFWDTKFLQEVSPFLQSIQNLHIHYLNDSLGSGETIHFKSVKVLQIDGFFVNNKIPLSFDQLEEFSITYFSTKPAVQCGIIDFITKHSTISKLNVAPNVNYLYLLMSKETKVRLSKGLPSLIDANFNATVFSMDEIIAFLDECKSLIKIQFKMRDTEQFHDLQKCLSTKWKGSANGSNFLHVTLLRTSEQTND